MLHAAVRQNRLLKGLSRSKHGRYLRGGGGVLLELFRRGHCPLRSLKIESEGLVMKRVIGVSQIEGTRVIAMVIRGKHKIDRFQKTSFSSTICSTGTESPESINKHPHATPYLSLEEGFISDQHVLVLLLQQRQFRVPNGAHHVVEALGLVFALGLRLVHLLLGLVFRLLDQPLLLGFAQRLHVQVLGVHADLMCACVRMILEQT